MVDEKKKCPACDIEKLSYSPLEALVLGLAIGRIGGPHSFESGILVDMVCDKHRHRFVIAELQATAKMTEDANA